MAEYNAQWYHRVLCEHLDKFVSREIKNLMVFMPPQHGKSLLVSRLLPAYILGKNPDAKIIAASYAAELIQGMNRDVQRVIESDAYGQVFPETRLNSSNVRTVAGSYLRNNDIFEIVGKRGQYRCAGVGGGLTGFPCDYGIIDDPYKDYKEAMSPTVRKAVWEWYTSVFLSRTHVNTGKLLTQTRWHEMDLAGMLLDKEPDQWTVLKLPAICENAQAANEQRQEGEALWPERFPVEMLRQRKALNAHQFEALYQQNPRPREGSMFQRNWFEIVAAVPAEAQRVRWWDMGATEGDGDWTVGTLMARAGSIYYVEDVVRFRYGATKRDDQILNVAAQDKAKYNNTVQIWGPQDPGAAGKSAALAFRTMLAGYPVYTEIESGSKEVRADPFASQAGAGNVKLLKAPWNEEWLAEYEVFNSGAYDDQVDSGSNAFNKLAPTPFRPFAV